MLEERALFRSIEEALLWAWYFARHEPGMVEPPSFSRFISDNDREQIDEKPRAVNAFSAPTAAKPQGYDAAGQAGMIKSFIEALPEPERYHLMAIALRARDRTDAQRHMRVIVMGMMEVKASSGLVYELVAKHYGKRDVTMVSLSKKYKIDRRKVTNIRRQLEITLDAIGYRAETRAYVRLQSMGVVQ